MGIPRICFTRIPPANNPSESHEISIVIRVYHANRYRVDCPNRFPIYSGRVDVLAPKYLGAKTNTSIMINRKAYQAKFPDTIPELYPALADASSMEGPTFVPHMVSPIANQPRLLFARKRLSFLFFFATLAQKAIPNKIRIYPTITAMSIKFSAIFMYDF
jgi:hypothetical protein